jgi:hypothetical protein
VSGRRAPTTPGAPSGPGTFWTRLRSEPRAGRTPTTRGPPHPLPAALRARCPPRPLPPLPPLHPLPSAPAALPAALRTHCHPHPLPSAPTALRAHCPPPRCPPPRCPPHPLPSPPAAVSTHCPPRPLPSAPAALRAHCPPHPLLSAPGSDQSRKRFGTAPNLAVSETAAATAADCPQLRAAPWCTMISILLRRE